MLRFFLGADGMQELELPRTPALAAYPVVAGNLIRYQILTRTVRGREWVQRWGERSRNLVLDEHFGPQSRQVAPLPPAVQAS